ncbi:MAG: Ca-activated chloride channel family protein [Crocinitomix sp.]|jgi:Ca-activated chloride channel family protein
MKALIIVLSLLISFTSFTQNFGEIRGKVIDQETGEPLPFVKVTLEQTEGVQLYWASTDFDGIFKLSPLECDTFDLRIQFIGYETQIIKAIYVAPDRITMQNIEMATEYQSLDCIVVTREDIRSMPVRSASGVYSTVTGGLVNIRGSRADQDGGYKNQNTESYSKIEANKFKKVKNDPLSTFSIDVDKAAYSNTRRFITAGNLPPADAVRIEEMINYFHYDYAQPTDDRPFSIHTEYTECAWNKEHQLVKIGLKGKELEMENAPASNLVFLIDVSGSMQSENKLDLLITGFELLVDQLRPKDKISVVVYAGAAGVVLESTAGSKKKIIKDALEGLTAGGSTAGGEGIELAYAIAKKNFVKNGNNRVILASDGDFNVGTSSESELEKLIERKREDDIFLSVLGFGTGNYQDSKMERLADKGNGNYAYIDNIFEAKKVLVTEIGGTLFTIAKDVKIQVEFNPKHVKGYRLIGYENRVLENDDFNDDKKDAGELGAGHTVTALYEIIPTNSKETVSNIDPLKYQNTSPNDGNSNEILTVKLRYKEPKGTKSKLIEQILLNKVTPLNEASIDIKFASAIAEFGLLLRDSEFKADASFEALISRARSAKGKDAEGYRAEFIRLAEMAEELSD